MPPLHPRPLRFRDLGGPLGVDVWGNAPRPPPSPLQPAELTLRPFDPAASYGSTIFEVLQNYTPTLPKNLWLAVNEKGVHIMRRRNKEPLITYEYRNIVNYSPSLRNLMIVTESLTRGTKYVFNTTQVGAGTLWAVRCLAALCLTLLYLASPWLFVPTIHPTTGVANRPFNQGLHPHHHPTEGPSQSTAGQGQMRGVHGGGINAEQMPVWPFSRPIHQACSPARYGRTARPDRCNKG